MTIELIHNNKDFYTQHPSNRYKYYFAFNK